MLSCLYCAIGIGDVGPGNCEAGDPKGTSRLSWRRKEIRSQGNHIYIVRRMDACCPRTDGKSGERVPNKSSHVQSRISDGAQRPQLGNENRYSGLQKG